MSRIQALFVPLVLPTMQGENLYIFFASCYHTYKVQGVITYGSVCLLMTFPWLWHNGHNKETNYSKDCMQLKSG
jgi:hypothetical protein